jgi:hypothetical protein
MVELVEVELVDAFRG